MNIDLQQQISELQGAYSALIQVNTAEDKTVISGPLYFSSTPDGMENICETFNIELHIPRKYPVYMPYVVETGGRISKDFHHLNDDGTLCLAVPMEVRRIFQKQPSLLGFVDKLVVPYLYGYCYWSKHGKMPFDEAQHGAAGIFEHYKDVFHPKSEDREFIRALYNIYRYGYRGHHPCPCGSGRIIRKCHSAEVKQLSDDIYRMDLTHDLLAIFELYNASKK